MVKRPPPSVGWPLEWFLGAACLVALFFINGFLSDGDTGVHIRAGQYMLEHRIFIREDIFSYFTPAVPWHNHEWLSQILMAQIFNMAGLKGVVLGSSILASFILFLLFKQIKAKAGAAIALFVFAFAFLNLSVHFLARPHLFTLFFAIIWKKILDDFQEGKRNRLFLLPFLMLFWVNLHGGFVIGILLLGIYGVGNFFPLVLGGIKAKEKDFQHARSIVFTILGCFLATLINPDGIYIWHYVLGFTSNPLLMDRIAEFKSTDFHEFSPLIHFVYLSLVVFAASRTPLSFIEWLLTATFACMALYSTRHLPLLTLVTAPFVAGKFFGVSQAFGVWFSVLISKMSRPLSPKVMPWVNSIFVTAVLAGLIYVLSPLQTYAYDPEGMPVEAVEFIQKQNIPGRIFTNDEFGDYIIFKLWPERKVFIYGWFNDTGMMERFRDYLEMGLVRPHWQETLEKHRINAVLSGTEAPLTGALAAHPGWKLIYSDKTASLFIRDLPANQPWIQPFSGTVLSEVKPL